MHIMEGCQSSFSLINLAAYNTLGGPTNTKPDAKVSSNSNYWVTEYVKYSVNAHNGQRELNMKWNKGGRTKQVARPAGNSGSWGDDGKCHDWHTSIRGAGGTELQILKPSWHRTNQTELDDSVPSRVEAGQAMHAVRVSTVSFALRWKWKMKMQYRHQFFLKDKMINLD